MPICEETSSLEAELKVIRKQFKELFLQRPLYQEGGFLKKAFFFLWRPASKFPVPNSFCPYCCSSMRHPRAQDYRQCRLNQLEWTIIQAYKAEILQTAIKSGDMNNLAKLQKQHQAQLMHPIAPKYGSYSLSMDQFKFVRPITHGAFGQIFLVEDLIRGRNNEGKRKSLMAGKVISIAEAIQKDCLASYVRERNFLLQCQSPHIISLYYSFRSEYFIFQMMELVENSGDLSAFLALQPEKRLAEETVSHILLQLLEALNELSRLGIVHGDLKLENIMVTEGLLIKLIDFGLAFKQPQPSGPIKASLGTPEYMAPEQVISGEKGFPADMWSLGCCLFELLAGWPPFYASSPREILMKLVEYADGRLKLNWNDLNCSAGMKDLLQQLLQPNPSQRATLKDVSRHNVVRGFVKPTIHLSTVNDRDGNDLVFERNRRFEDEGLKMYSLAVLNSERVFEIHESMLMAEEEKYYSAGDRLQLLELFPLKNLNKL